MIPPALHRIVSGSRPDLPPSVVREYQRYAQVRWDWKGGPVFRDGVGTKLKEIIRREVGSIPCTACLEMVQQLDTMTAVEIDADRENIIDGIIERGRHQLKWWSPGGFALKFAPEQVRALVESWLDEAQRRSNEFSS